MSQMPTPAAAPALSVAVVISTSPLALVDAATMSTTFSAAQAAANLTANASSSLSSGRRLEGHPLGTLGKFKEPRRAREVDPSK